MQFLLNSVQSRWFHSCTYSLAVKHFCALNLGFILKSCYVLCILEYENKLTWWLKYFSCLFFDDLFFLWLFLCLLLIICIMLSTHDVTYVFKIILWHSKTHFCHFILSNHSVFFFFFLFYLSRSFPNFLTSGCNNMKRQNHSLVELFTNQGGIVLIGRSHESKVLEPDLCNNSSEWLKYHVMLW